MNGREERIRLRAYQLWQADGCCDGRDVEHWAQAEREVDAEAAAAPADPGRPQAAAARKKVAKAAAPKAAGKAAARKKPATTRSRKAGPAGA